MRGDYDPTNIKPIATKDLISWAYQVSIDLINKLVSPLVMDVVLNHIKLGVSLRVLHCGVDTA